MSRRTHSSLPRPCHPSGDHHIRQNDGTRWGSYQEVSHCCGCCPGRRPRPVSPSKSARLYREHAAHYAHKFRAAIDYTIQEKPRQIISGVVLLLFLYVIGFRAPVAPPPAATDISTLQRGWPGANSRGCTAQTAGPPAKLNADNGHELSCLTHTNEQEPFEEGGELREVHHGSSSHRAGEQSLLTTGDEGTEEHGKHVTAPAVSWEGVFPAPTQPVPPASDSVRRGVFALLVMIALYTFLQSKDGLLVRPHPGFWRVVHGICVAHLLLLVWLLAVTPEVGRETLQLLFPEITGKRKNVFAGTLVADCRINADTFYRQITSVWFVSHVVGWLLKMIILRDWGFCLLYSISFEVAELSFHWVVPELRECWWDSVVVDALLSNLSGMLLGVVLMKIVNVHQYDWMGRHPLYRKLVMRFTPFGGGYEWAFYKTPRHLGLAVVLLLLCLFTELNVFFLIAFLDLPAAHYCNPLRVTYLTLLGASAAAEHYEYTVYSRERIGHNEWLLGIILIVELMVCAKYGSGRLKNAVIPPEIYSCWGVSLALFGIWCWCYFTVKRDFVDADEVPAQNRVQRKTTEHVNDCASVKARGQSVKQDAKDTPTEVVPLGDTLTKGNMRVVPKKFLDRSWRTVTGQRLQWYRDRLRLLVLTVPPQACFVPLVYLSKFYYYDYEELKLPQESP